MAAKQTDIIISGAGAAGLTLAILLARAGLKIGIIDPADAAALSNDELSGRTVALMNSSLNVLQSTGVWPALQELSNPLSTMTIVDISRPDKEPVEQPFEACDLDEEQYGFNIPNNALRAALFKAAQDEANVTFYLERKLAEYSVEGNRVSVRLDDGEELRAALLVGADGRNSKVREIAGIDVQKKTYDQAAITCVINHSKNHNDTSTEFHRPEGPLAVVPLPGNQSSVVWVNTHEHADALLKLKKGEFEQALQSEMQDLLGGITLEINPQSWPLSSIKAKALIAERVALIAEAAHVMSPITAQGLNLSLRDVAGLAETVIDAARVGQDFGSQVTLKAYEKRRRFDVDSRVFGVDHMNRIVSNDIEAVKELRHAGLKTLGYIPPLKRFAMRVGLAPAVDAGRLSKGDTL
jgi:2-octaprenyl-6-methoxyphenol hydroxylase